MDAASLLPSLIAVVLGLVAIVLFFKNEPGGEKIAGGETATAAPGATASEETIQEEAEVDLASLKSSPGIDCSGKSIPADKITYDDDGFLGKKLPVSENK